MNAYQRLYREYAAIHGTEEDPYRDIDPLDDEEALIAFYGEDYDRDEIISMVSEPVIDPDDEDAEWMALCDDIDETFDYAPERF